MAMQGMNKAALTAHGRGKLTAHIGILCLLTLAGSIAATPVAAYEHSNSTDTTYQTPEPSNPFLQQRPPLSVPVKALVERFLLQSRVASERSRNFRYDIDTLGQGMKVRMRLRF